ncbi:hypothetical protein SSX86_014003 [Deinandra increscens subsp. villosa]|uniref:Uncharacterized protein n=1 Tax=Deinandra increscens subsp. villosa TaxID=3103831 RepID=A0AAP0D5Q9_9ASTR
MMNGPLRRDKRVGQRVEDWMHAPLTFPPQIGNYSESAMTVALRMGGYKLRRVLVDTGSSADIIYEECFRRLAPEDRERLEPVFEPLSGFSGETCMPIGQIDFPVTMGDGTRDRTVMTTFLVVPAKSEYNAIIGRPTLGNLAAAVSTAHGLLMLPTPRGVAKVWAEKPMMIAELSSQPRASPSDKTEKWVINPRFPEQTVTLGASLSPKIRHHLKQLLQENMDIFAFTHSDMTGVPRDVAEHHLGVSQNIKPYVQKQRHMGEKRKKFITSEVQKLEAAGIVRQIKNSTWIANPVVVPKADGTWRMCVDYTNLNKACPKDAYPLPVIDEKVDSLVPFRLKCFLDAYKGYHQRMMDKVFKGQIGKNVEVYVDGLVIKSLQENRLLPDIVETFTALRKNSIKLNPGKCSFGMEEGKFLGVIITKEGFRVHPEKVAAVVKMQSPASLKEVQALNGRLVAINRFLSKHAERSLPFISVLKKCLSEKQFEWTTEAEQAFQDLKAYLVNLPALTAPQVNEVLKMYLSTSPRAVSSVLLVERADVQTPIYYISRVLTDAEANYSILEKLVLALVHASRRQRRYFQAHDIEILTSYPLQHVLRKPDLSGRLCKWAIELGVYSLTFKPRTAVKGQVIADFISEIPAGTQVTPEDLYLPKSKEIPAGQTWELHSDGASSTDGAGAGVILISPAGKEYARAYKLNFRASNNEAEYEALIAGLKLALKYKAKHVRAHIDSLLAANQINAEYEAKDEAMAKYLSVCKALIKAFETCVVMHVPRSKNKKADALSKLASCFAEPLQNVHVEEMKDPAIQIHRVNVAQQSPESWTTPIVKYLTDGRLPLDKGEARKLRSKCENYQMVNGILYRRTYLGPLLRCVDPEEANYLIREIHMGICGIHAGPKAVVAKLKGAGYYWPGMHAMAVEELKRCMSCQKYAPVISRPKNNLIPVTSAWPFQKWAVDIVGPFPEATGRVKFLIVAVDYFTKWVEAKPLATISAVQVKKFLWEFIVCRFGIPLYLVTDNGTQFADKLLKQWCTELQIQQIFTSVAHPQGNGQVERINRSILEGIKTRLDFEGASWVDEVPHVLWAHRTMKKSSTGETPFSLTYGSEAMIPAEIGIPSYRHLNSHLINNDEEIRHNLDLLEERRELAAFKEKKYKEQLKKYYNRHVHKVTFKEGEYVLRSNEASRTLPLGKLAPNWEGPYVVKKDLGKGAYELAHLDGKPIPRTWNSAQLRRCYI